MRIGPNVDETHLSKWQAHGRRLWLPFCLEPVQHTLEYLHQRDKLRGVHMKSKGAAKNLIQARPPYQWQQWRHTVYSEKFTLPVLPTMCQVKNLPLLILVTVPLSSYLSDLRF